MSGYAVFPTFLELTRSPSSGVLVVWLGATKPPARPEDGDGVVSRKLGKSSHPDAADCPRKFN